MKITCLGSLARIRNYPEMAQLLLGNVTTRKPFILSLLKKCSDVLLHLDRFEKFK